MGEVVSSTVTVNVQVALLPLASVPVIEIVWGPKFMAVFWTGDWVTVGEAVQLSETLAIPVRLGNVYVQFPPACTRELPGQVRTGLVESFTVTPKEQLLVLPVTSDAVRVMVLLPRFSILPEDGLWVTLGLGSQLSERVAPPVRLGRAY